MNGKKFTSKELELLNDKSLTHTDIAKLTGRSPSTIFLKRKALGIKGYKDGSRTLSDYVRSLIYDTTKPSTEVAKLTGKPAKQITTLRHNYGII